MTDCTLAPDEAETADAKLIGYARVSRDDQNLNLQRDALIRAGVNPLDIYEDKESGAKAHRRGLDAMFRDLRVGDTLVIWKIDRLGRSVLDLIHFIEGVRRRGAHVRVLTGLQIDTSTAAGKMMFHISAAFAEFERELIRERTMAGLEAARERGKRGGRAPVLTPERQAKAREMLLARIPVTKIAKEIGVSKAVLYLHRRDLMAPNWSATNG